MIITLLPCMDYKAAFPKSLTTLSSMKNIIPGQRRIFGYGFKDIVGPLKTKSGAQRDESSLKVRQRL